MSFFKLKNLSDSVADPMEKPWDYEPTCEVEYPTKPEDVATFKQWGAKCTTDHAYLSMYEGLSVGVRVTKGPDGNHPFRLHGLIVDYDSKSPAGMKEHIQKNTPSAILPRWLVHTASGNSRLVWMFERPLMLASHTLTRKFLALVSKELKLVKWAGGFDADAFGDPTRYFEIGKQWEKLFDDAIIPTSMTEAWLLKAAEDVRLDEDKTLRYKIPFADLSTEMHNRFPGRWTGDLYPGARGVRFWDPSADNDSAAVAFAEGMYCFTGNRSFVPWDAIFGKAFVDKYEADYVSGAVENSAYDGKSFWIMEDDVWDQWSKEDFAQELRCRGYDGVKPRGKTASEIDTIENVIKKTKRVSKALPFLFYPAGIINYKGAKYMNTSTVRVLQPSAPFAPSPMESISSIKLECPFLYKFFVSLFSEDQNPEDPQLIAFLSWLKYFYQSSYEGKPGPGQALVLAGAAGKGKTFLNRAVLGGLMGGHNDASHHLVDGSQWTDLIANSPIMAIDDAIATSDYQTQVKFTQRLKKYTANASVSYNAKYGATGEVPWFGRAIITCNLDPESLRILPGMDQATRDKIMLFRTSPVIVKFGTWEELEKMLAKELPKFARFLLEWPMPEDRISDEARFYVKPYHDKALFEEALYQSADGTTTEVLIGFLSQYFEEYPTRDVWEGSGVLLHAQMSERFDGVMRAIKPRQLATCLGNLAKNGYELERTRRGKIRQWTIKKSFVKDHHDE
jgi:hypothetical protein